MEGMQDFPKISLSIPQDNKIPLTDGVPSRVKEEKTFDSWDHFSNFRGMFWICTWKTEGDCSGVMLSEETNCTSSSGSLEGVNVDSEQKTQIGNAEHVENVHGILLSVIKNNLAKGGDGSGASESSQLWTYQNKNSKGVEVCENSGFKITRTITVEKKTKGKPVEWKLVVKKVGSKAQVKGKNSSAGDSSAKVEAKITLAEVERSWM